MGERKTHDELLAENAALQDQIARLEAQLQQQDNRYYHLYHDAPLAYFAVGTNGQIKNANQQACELLEYDRAELIGTPVFALYADTPHGKAKAEQVFECFKNGQKIMGEDLQMISGSGRLIWINLSVHVVRNETGEIIESFSVVQDITERKQTEQTLQASEERYRTYIENAPDGIFVADANDRYVDVNPAACQMTGYSRNELLRMSIPELTSPEARSEALAIFAELKATGRVQAEVLLRKKDGTDFHASLAAVALSDEQFMAFCSDISAQKLIEEELRDSKNRLVATFNQSSDLQVISRVEADGAFRIVMVNDTYINAAKASGYDVSRETIIGQAISALITDEFELGDHVLEYTINSYRQAVEAGQPVRREETLETPLKTLHFESMFIPIFDPPDTCRYILYNSRDVTERKQAEKALLASEEQFRQIAETFREVFYLYDPAIDKFLYVSPAYETLFQEPIQNVYDDPFSFTYKVHPDDQNRFFEAVRRERENGKYLDLEYRIVRADGTVRHVWSRNYPIFDETGMEYRVVGISEDITERKQVEEALRESEDRLAEAQRIAHIGHWTWDIVTGETHCSEEFFRIFGLDLKQGTSTANVYKQFIHPDDLEQERSASREALTTPGKGYEVDHRIIRADGTERFVVSKGEVTHWSPDGKPLFMIGTTQDITERKQMETQLQHSEESLKLAQEVAHLGSWQWNIKTNQLEWSDEMYRIFGIDKDTFSGALDDTIAQVIHPDDRAKFERANRSVIHEDKPIPVEYRIILPDQSIRTIWAEASRFILDKAGNPTILMGIVQDITERKHVEAAQRASQQLIQQIADIIPHQLYVFDLIERQNIYINRVTEEFWGLSLTEFQIQSSSIFGERLHPDDLDKFVEFNVQWKTAQDSQVFVKEYRLRNADEEYCWIRSFESVLSRDADGTPIQIVGIAEDITERKQIETALAHERDMLARLMQTSPVGITIVEQSGQIALANPRAEEILGLDRDAITQRTYNALDWRTTDVNGEPFPDEQLPFRRVMETSQPIYGVEHAIEWPDGKRVLLSINSSPLLTPDGDFEGMVSTIEDITVRKQAEDALRESEAKYQLFFESTGTINSIFDTECCLIMQNSLSIHFLGYPEGEALGKNVFELFGPEMGAAIYERMQRVIATQQPETFVTEFDLSTGKRWFRSSFQPLIDRQGEITGIQVVSQEITEQKRAEEALEQYQNHLEDLVHQRTAELEAANKQLITLSQIKDEFVSNVSHELKSPLTTLTLRHHLLRRHPDKLDNHLDVLERETARLDRTIEDLLRLSRLDQNRIEVVFNPVDLNAILETLVQDRQLQAEQKGLSLTFMGQTDLPLIMADQGLMEQVLSILLTNAINYTPPNGQITVCTQIDQASDRHWVGFSVEDTGLGISPEEQSRLFERFFQGSAHRQAGVSGTGLGLAIAKEIVDRHYGRIDVESTGIPGESTTFRVWLPIGEEMDG